MFTLLIACSGAPHGTLDPPPGAPVDADGDGVAADQDCDDADDTVFPGAPEVSQDGVDQDCDGVDACSDPRTWWSGDVELAGASDWDALCQDHDAVTGDLIVWADAPAELQGCLCEVGGDLTLAAETGAGLRGVTAIGGQATTLWPHDLRSLQHAGGLSVAGAEIALRRLRTVDGSLTVRGEGDGVALLPALETVGDVLQIDGVGSVTLPALTQVGTLDLSGTDVVAPALGHLDRGVLGPGFVALDVASLRTVSDLSLWGATLVAPTLTAIDALYVNHAVATSLPSVSWVGDLEGTGDAPELPGLTHLDHLTWDLDPAYPSAALWGALPNVATVDRATFSGDVDLSGLPSELAVDQLRLERATLTGALTDPALIAGDLILEDLDNASLAPLATVQHVPASLRILSCRSLTSLDLDSLETVGAGLLLSRNGALPDSEIDALLDRIDVAGNVVVE